MSNYSNYVCSVCGEPAWYDGRCGDGPYLVCKCSTRGVWIDDGRGGYMVYPNNAEPISIADFRLNKR